MLAQDGISRRDGRFGRHSQYEACGIEAHDCPPLQLQAKVR
jgi:hypothetical protein